MKAAVLTQLNAPLEIDEVMPHDLSYGQVLVRVIASGICGAQLQEIRGEKGNARFIPHLLGHEAAGIVQEIGVGVTKVKPGDRVVLHWRKGDGIESDFPRYEFRGKTIQSGKVTTFGQYTIASENRLTPVPNDTPVELCALLGCGLSTALGTVEREAQLKLGESILVVGVGGLGVNLIRAATLVGAHPIVAVDVNPSRRTAACEVGATFFMESSELPPRSSFDVIVETSGSVTALRQTLPLLAPNGRYIMVGHPKVHETVEMLNADHMFGGDGKTLKATQGGGFQPSLDIPRYIRAHKAGLLKLDGIITHRLKLQNINQGIESVRNGHASRVLIEMD